jgi:hypothetical protein
MPESPPGLTPGHDRLRLYCLDCFRYWAPNGNAAVVVACPLLRDERHHLRHHGHEEGQGVCDLVGPQGRDDKSRSHRRADNVLPRVDLIIVGVGRRSLG